MLTADQVRALIVTRIVDTSDSCNSYHLGHVSGQLRALVAVLNDGTPAHAHCCDDLRDLLRAAQIPYRDLPGGEIDFLPEWLVEHGFEIDGDPDDPDSTIRHPVFSEIDW